MRYAKVRSMDIVNGCGVVCSLFLQGCTHHCKGCFNKETWDFKGGKEWTDIVNNKFLTLCSNPNIDAISVLGGEPLDQAIELYELLSKVKQQTNKPIYLWSGYLYEDIVNDSIKFRLVKECVNVLIDGKFKEELKDLKLKLRGSSNQRVIDVKKSLEQNKVVLWEEC